MWLRRMPSSLPPIRLIALRDCSFSTSVLSSTRMHFMDSNAWHSIRYLASVFTAERCPPVGGINVPEPRAPDDPVFRTQDRREGQGSAVLLPLKSRLYVATHV